MIETGSRSKAGGPVRSVPMWHSAGWLLLDMALVTTMQAIVRAEGQTYPAIQLVFLRSLVGFISVTPLVWRNRAELANLSNIRNHLSRVGFNSVALTLNFAAFAALPLAVVTAIGFTRPLVLLAMASLILKERIGWIRYAFAALGFSGVIVMLQPGAIPWNVGLLAAFGSVLFGSLAVVQTRRLAGENTVVLMLFYTVGLTVLTCVPAAVVWVPIPWSEGPNIILVGVLAQLGQYCWLQAYQRQEAGRLAPIGYLSIIFSGTAGWLFFQEIPSPTVLLGALIVVATTLIAPSVERWFGRTKAARDGKNFRPD